MAKNREQQSREDQRISRKEFLIARRKQEERRKAWMVVIAVTGLLALVFLVGFINEYIVVPGRPVATVAGEEISLSEWEKQVRYQRARLILLLEDQLQAFTDPDAPNAQEAEIQALSFVQQFMGQQIVALTQAPEVLGEFVLDRMIDDILIRQEAERRGITVTDADIDTFIGETFNYFGGESPTALPSATATVQPTPSLTPIPTAVITEVVPTEVPLPTATLGPTSTPLPTATAVSQESFEEQRRDELSRFRALGVSDETYRNSVRDDLYRERLREALAEEADLPATAEHLSFYFISTDSEARAEALRQEISAEDYLTVWNRIRSTPQTVDGDEQVIRPVASEIVWRVAEELEARFSAETIAQLQELPVGRASDVVAETDPAMVDADEENATTYYLFQVSGREQRPLSPAALQEKEAELLTDWLDEQRVSVEIIRTEFWRDRVPQRPFLDPKFTRPLPTPTSAPPIDTPAPLPVLPTEESAPAATPTADDGT